MALLFACFCHISAAQASTTIALRTVIVEGATAFPASRFFGAYRTQLGAPITRESARAVVDGISALYTSEGFVQPEVVVDDSLVVDGVLRLRVHEARISRVIYEGDRGNNEVALDRIAARVTAAVPLRRDDVSAALREIRGIAGLTATATTRRDAASRNAHELVVHTEHAAVEGIVRANNRGTREAGPGFLLGQLYLNGLIGGQERFGLVFAMATDPAEYRGGGLLIDVPLGHSGTRLNTLLFNSRSAPNERPVNLADVYSRDRVTVKVSHPLLPPTATSLILGGGLEMDTLVIRRADERIREDQLRVLEASLRGALRATGGMQYAGTLLLRKGIDGLGATLHAPDLTDDPRRLSFLVTQLQGTVLRRFATHWTLRLDAFAQYSGQVLPDGERFKIGGDRLGRGFEVAEIAGDRGLGGKLELRRDLFDTRGFAGRLSTYGFYDIGAAWKSDFEGRESATTAGVGIASSGARLTGYLELAAPVSGPDIEGQRDPTLFAELSWRF